MGSDTGLDEAERSRIENALDRIEDRLHGAPFGLHVAGRPADPQVLASSDLPPGAALLWARWNGLALGHEDFELLPVEAHAAATQAAGDDGRIAAGDRVVGGRGRLLYVLPPDPWEEGADVVQVEETGERAPEASSVAHLVLATLGELAVLHDADGEFRDELFGDDGELLERVERKLLRRRLDLDPDAPHARYRLARLFRRAGELVAARRELEGVLVRAPNFAWAQHELARTHLDAGDLDAARRAAVAAAELVDDPPLRAHFLAWAARAASGAARTELATRVERTDPGFVQARVAGIRELLAAGDGRSASELLSLALAVAPANLDLLALREPVDRASSAAEEETRDRPGAAGSPPRRA